MKKIEEAHGARFSPNNTRLVLSIQIYIYISTMDEENRLLVTDETVEFEKERLQKKYRSFQRNLEKIPHIDKEIPERCPHVTGWTWKH